jgi:hypothetical protein
MNTTTESNVHPLFARLIMPIRPRVIADADDDRARMDAEDQEQAAKDELNRRFNTDSKS